MIRRAPEASSAARTAETSVMSPETNRTRSRSCGRMIASRRRRTSLRSKTTGASPRSANALTIHEPIQPCAPVMKYVSAILLGRYFLLLKSIKLNPVIGKDSPTLVLIQVCEQALESVQHSFVGRGQQTNRPIAAKYRSLRTKIVERGFYIRLQVLDSPVGPIRFSHQTRQFA